jgi:hypothetical protein
VSYLDFEIRIRSDGRGGNRVDVLRSPAGDGTGALRLPISTVDLVERRTRIRGRANGHRDLHLPGDPVSEDRQRELAGAELFDALFDDHLRSLYERSLEIVRREEGRRLRLLLKIDPACADLAHIQAQPWEYLFHSRQGRFPCLYRQSPLVRVLDVEASPRSEASGVLRILVMASHQDELDRLDLDQELRHLRELSAAHPAIEVEILPDATLAGLRAALLAREFHVLHYMGHGDFDPDTGAGTLALTGADGTLLQVPGRNLAHVLYDHRSLRLAVLNACETAKDQDRDGQNPFAGVGAALIQGGVPAVIAMQAPVTDDSAIAFADCFYRRLAEGDPLDVAVSEGRQRIFTAGNAQEWGTPVLFTSAPDLEVFRPPPPATGLRAALLRRRRAARPFLLSAAAAVLALAAVWALAALRPAPAAEASIELEVSSLGFRLERPYDPLNNLPLAELAASDLRRVELPAVEDRPARALRPENGRPLGVRLSRADGGPRLTLNQSSFPAGLWIYLEAVGEGRYRLELFDHPDDGAVAAGGAPTERPKSRIRVNFDGPLDFKSLYQPLERLVPRGPASIELTPRTGRLAVDLVLDGPEAAALAPDVAVTGLEFVRIEDRSSVEQTDLRALSTVLSGRVRFASGPLHELQKGEVLRIGDCAGVLRRVVLGRNGLSVDFRGRVSAASAEVPGSSERNLMPSFLTDLLSSQTL